MANKLGTYIIMMTGLVLLFYFAGLLQECDNDGICEGKTPNSALLDLLLNPQGMNVGTFAANIAILLSALAVASITIGFFNNQAELAARAIFGTYLLTLLWDFLYVIGKIWSVNPIIAILVFSPILVLFSVTLVDWVAKND